MDIQRLLATCAAQPQTATVAPPSEVPTTATVRVMSSRSAAPGGRQLPPPAAPAALQPTCALSTAPMLSTPSKPDADLSSPLHPLLQSPDTDLWLPPSSVEIVSGPLGCSESRENPTAPESRGGEPMMLYPSRCVLTIHPHIHAYRQDPLESAQTKSARRYTSNEIDACLQSASV
jgi:hypothetical protein